MMDVTEVNVNDIDALFMPGGLRLPKTSVHSLEGANASIEEDIKALSQRPSGK